MTGIWIVAAGTSVIAAWWGFDRWVWHKYRHGTGAFWDDVRAKVRRPR